MTIGERISQFRKSAGMTQEALAQKLGITNQAVSKWESDQSCPDITLLPGLADTFGVTVDALFGRETQLAPVLPWEDDGTLRVVLYVGHRHVGAHPLAGDVQFCYEGPALNIHSELAVRCGDVAGGITAGGDVTCDDVGGSITAQGNVTCDDVRGNITAQGNVTCDDVEGPIQADGNVTCDEIRGNVVCGGNFTADEIHGDIIAGGTRH